MSAKEVTPRLGRGLAALLGEPAAPTNADRSVRSLPIEFIEPGPFQPRGPIDPAALEALASSIRQRGVLQPILVRPHPANPARYQIIAGERRWRAAQQASLHEIPALVRTLSDMEAMAAALVENLQRQDLNAIEEAEGYRRLLADFGLTQENLADAVGKSRSHVANTLRLLNLPTPVQAEVKNGALSAGHARALLSHPEPEKAALSVISRGLNVRQTEDLVARATPSNTRHSPSAQAARQKDPETLSLEQDLTSRLGLRVEISYDGRKGAIRIHYNSLDQLDGIVTLLGGG
ncbi:MAG TPA: ParB/RepB/Spo0J family partition protein [Acetobacteraceae bacterium]|nr:ParB/RepB/Spo0J family partition protein [Acetobacteraceae bacterium]